MNMCLTKSSGIFGFRMKFQDAHKITVNLNLALSRLGCTCPADQCFCTFCTTWCSLTRSRMAEVTTSVWNANRPIYFQEYPILVPFCDAVSMSVYLLQPIDDTSVVLEGQWPLPSENTGSDLFLFFGCDTLYMSAYVLVICIGQGLSQLHCEHVTTGAHLTPNMKIGHTLMECN